VLELIEKPFEGEDEYGDDMGNKIMSIANPDNCIGCEACSRICTKRCHVHIEM
jgi:formate hydrogenlyase subunit 6/NADH:ubiquinone oxidoreductase subunit I